MVVYPLQAGSKISIVLLNMIGDRGGGKRACGGEWLRGVVSGCVVVCCVGDVTAR